MFADDKPVQHSVIEGVKDIQGVEVTYTYRLFRFSDSFAMVATGIPGGRPTPDVEQFLASLSLGMAATTLRRVYRLSPRPFLPGWFCVNW